MRTIGLILLLALATTTAVAQQAKHRLADRHYQEYAYDKARVIYQDIVNKSPEDALALRRLGTCHRNLGDLQDAERVLEVLCNLESHEAGDHLLLADVYKLNKRYTKASEAYREYLKVFPDETWLLGYTEDLEWANKILRDSAQLDITGAGVNSAASDFAACLVEGRILFSSGRSEGKGSRSAYSWNDQSYLNLFEADLGADSTLTGASVMDNEANTRYHEGSVAYDAYNKTLYFTRNQFYKGQKDRAKDGTLRLAIYSARYEKGELGRLKPFKHNDADYSTGHPAISPKGTVLIFASDRPGGFGGTDLYSCTRTEEGWSDPINLGAAVNTPGNEMFPYLDADSVLTFASSGLPGLGGLDLFRLNLADSTDRPKNVGYPINGEADDFGLIMLSDKRGIFTSNRPGGMGDDDLYAFQFSNPDSVQVSGQIRDAITLEPLGGVDIYAVVDGQRQWVGVTNPDGTYQVDLPFSKTYSLEGEKEGYEPLSYDLEQDGNSAYLDNVSWDMVPYDYHISGLVTSGVNGDVVEGALVRLYDQEGVLLTEVTSDENGEYLLLLDPANDYEVVVTHQGYTEKRVTFDTQDLDRPKINKDISLFKLEKGAVVRLDNIYYDYNSSYIREDAAVELDKVVALMQANPTLRIELSSHTDARGKDEYNRWLSDRRAQNAAEYIVSKGIAKSRIRGKGYGEDRLLNKCEDGVDCTDEEHQQNRRTEFTVLDI